MYVVQIIISLVGLLAIFYSARYFPLLNNLFLFMLFYFATVAFQMERQTNFYLLGLAFASIYEISLGPRFKQQSSKADLNGERPGGVVTGRAFEFLSVGIAALLYWIYFALSSAKGQIMGVAPLAVEVAVSWQSKLLLAFSPLLSGALGIIENKTFFAAFMILLLAKPFFGAIFLGLARIIPVLGGVLGSLAELVSNIAPFIIAPLLFGVFHIVSYLFDWSKMFLAAAMMALMIGSYFVTGRDVTAANLFHFGVNNTVTTRETLSIIG